MSAIASLISAALVIMIYSILYRENPLFRVGEGILVGATVGHAVVQAIFNVRDLAIIKVQQGLATGDISKILYVIPILLGIGLYLQFSKKYRYVSKISIAFMLSVGIALSMRGLLYNNVIGQIKGAIMPLNTIEGIAYTIGLISVLLYFVYEEKTSRIAGPLPNLGRYVLMITMGAYFANSIMGRLSIVIGTMDGVLVTPSIYLVPVAALVIVADVLTRRKQAE